MKPNRGRSLLGLLILLSAWLYGEDFTYDIHAETRQPYLKEPVLIVVDINQTNPDVVLFFRFEIQKSDAYTVKQIDATHDDTMHHASIHYRYLLYPLKRGKITVPITLVKRLTDEAKVAYSFSGDRDDFKKLETTDTHIDVTPLRLDVRPLPDDTQFVGDFTLKTFFPKKAVKAYEPLPMRVTIEGFGYPPLVRTLLPKDLQITHFDSKPVLTERIIGDRVKYTAVYELALSSDKSFTLPQIDLPAFNPETQRGYMLSIPEHRFDVMRVDVNTLVDKIDDPEPLHADRQWIERLLGYLIAFASGFATAWLFKWKRRQPTADRHPLIGKIEACKDKKALLQLLMAHEPTRFEPLISKLEEDIYREGGHTLKQLKQEAKEALK